MVQGIVLVLAAAVTGLFAYTFRENIKAFIDSFSAEGTPPAPGPAPLPAPEPAPVPAPTPEPSPAPVPGPSPTPDTVKPTLVITSPLVGTLLPSTKPIHATGTAKDNVGGQGIWKVEARLAEPLPSEVGDGWILCQPKAAGDWSAWMVDLPVHNVRFREIRVRCTDRALNVSWRQTLIQFSSTTGGFIPGSTVLLPTPSTTYSANPIYPVTLGSPVDMIRQAYIDSGYYAVLRSRVNQGTMTEAQLWNAFLYPWSWLKDHPVLYTSYPAYFKSVP